MITNNKLQIYQNLPAETLQRWEQIQAVTPAKWNQQTALSCMDVLTVWPQLKVTTYDDAIEAQTPTLGAVSFYLGEVHAIQLISDMIAAASLLLNAGKSLRKEQFFPIAELLYSEFKLLTVADFRACFRMAALGKFGQVYDRLDAEVIANWCTQYRDGKLAHCEQVNARKHANAGKEQNAQNGSTMPEFFKEYIRQRDVGKMRTQAEWQPDAAILQLWQQEYERIPEENRPDWSVFVKYQTAKTQSRLKK